MEDAAEDFGFRFKGQENTYKDVVKAAVSGAVGVINGVDCVTTECHPNQNVEALRVFMLNKKREACPVRKPMHRQLVYKDAPAYVNDVLKRKCACRSVCE